MPEVASLPATAPLLVLARPAFKARANPYTQRIYRAMKGDVVIQEWSLPRAALGRWNIVHVHWPETVFDHSLAEALVTTELLLGAIDIARARGARLLWTIHNLRAHGHRYPELETRFRTRWLTRVDAVIGLTEAGLEAARTTYPALAAVPGFVVPHPHYRGVYPDDVSRTEARRRLSLAPDAPVITFFGRVAAYKGLPELVDAFSGIADPQARLLVAGAPLTTEDRRALRRWSQHDARVVTVPRFIPANEVQTYLRAANLVVLPFREVLNSGSALLALSFDRRVLAPALGAMAELATQAGSRWVTGYEGRLTADLLATAVAVAMADPDRTAGDHLAPFEPALVARRTARAYHACCGS